MKFALAFLCAAPAWASMIASSNGVALTMQIFTKDSGLVSLRPGDIASVPSCSCASGAPIKVIEAWDGIATMNGVNYSEGGFAHIYGQLPDIGQYAVGTTATVVFPITWDYDVFLYRSFLDATPVFEFKDSGHGHGIANLQILQAEGLPAFYFGSDFHYVSNPEPLTFGLVGAGLLFLIVKRRGQSSASRRA